MNVSFAASDYGIDGSSIVRPDWPYRRDAVEYAPNLTALAPDGSVVLAGHLPTPTGSNVAFLKIAPQGIRRDMGPLELVPHTQALSAWFGRKSHSRTGPTRSSYARRYGGTRVARPSPCVIVHNTMKKRAGKTRTFSISVDEETQKVLRQEAARSYGGNVSALVSAIAKEAKRQAALDWLLQRADTSRISDDERARFLSEIDGVSPSTKRRRRAA